MEYVMTERSKSRGGVPGQVWIKQPNGKYACADEPGRELEEWMIKSDLSNGYLRKKVEGATE